MVKKFQEDNFMATLVHIVAVVKKKTQCYCQLLLLLSGGCQSQWVVVEICHGNDGNDGNVGNDGNDGDQSKDKNDGSRYSVGMHEGVWKRVDRPGEPANREHIFLFIFQ